MLQSNIVNMLTVLTDCCRKTYMEQRAGQATDWKKMIAHCLLRVSDN